MNWLRLFPFARRFLQALLVAWGVSLALSGTALAQSCAPAADRGTAPADFRDYCWFNFASYNDATARSTNGQLMTFNLPDGSVVRMTVRATTTGSSSSVAFVSRAVPAWTGAAFGNSAFNQIPGQPVLYSAVDGSTITLTLSNITVTAPTGGSASYSIVVGDGESTNAGETLTFTTNRGAWEQVVQIPNGTSTLYPTVTGVNTTTVTETGVNGTVGSYIFRSANNPTTVTARLVASGLQGVIIGMRYASVTVVSQISGTRYLPADQFLYEVRPTANSTPLVTGTTTGTQLAGTPAVVPTIAASYPFLIMQSMAPGSGGTLADYNTSLTCINSRNSAVVINNQPVNTATLQNLAYGDTILCTFTNTPKFRSISGFVYNDANHNGSKDGAEGGLGLARYVKLAWQSGGVCQSPAISATLVDAGTGAYTVPNVPSGSHCLIASNNNTLSEVTSNAGGWLGTQNPTGIIQLTVGDNVAPTAQNFGFYNGSQVSGSVFNDSGRGGGVARNGIRDGGELGLAGIVVRAVRSAAVVDSATTAGDGSYTLWIPTASGQVVVTPVSPSGYNPTGGSAGTTGGSYTLPSVSYTPAGGQRYTGANFGYAVPNSLSPNGAQTALPGTAVFYAHMFNAALAGQVTFSLSQVAQPAAAWSQVVYRDSNCNGVLDAGEPQLMAALAVSPGDTVCLIVKQFVPANAPMGAQNITTLTASWTSAIAPSLSVTDVTTVGVAAALHLSKLVSNVTQGLPASVSVSAHPADTMEYTLVAVNHGEQALTTLLVNDMTPAFTTYLSAACPAILPAGITACTVTAQPAVGAQGPLAWTFVGALASSAQLTVSYQVKVDF